MINFPVNIFKEHFYINGHVFQFSYCLVKGAGSHALPALMNTGCGLHQRQRSCVSLLWGLQCTCSTQRAGKIEMANPESWGYSQTSSLPPSLPAFPALHDLAFFQSCCAYTMQKAKLVFRFCSLPPKAAYPAALERNPFCTSWQRVWLPGTSGRLEDPLIPAVVAGLQGEDAGLSQTSDRHFGIPCWIRASGLGVAEKSCPDLL